MENFVAKAESKNSGAHSDSNFNLFKFMFVAVCEPRMKTSYKRISDAIKQVSKLKPFFSGSEFIIIFRNNEYVIGFNSENLKNCDDFKSEMILWQSK